MSTSDIKKLKYIYLVTSIFVFVFGLIYEFFSHGVYSNYMIFAFMIPLMFGFITFTIISRWKKKVNEASLCFYHMFIATLTIGSIMKGFLDIYGTTNSLIYVYLVVSLVLLFLSIIFLRNRKLQ